VLDGAFVLVDATGVRTVIPVGGLAAIMLEPSTRTSHTAVARAASAGTLLVWTGEAGVRVFAAGQPGGARSDKLLWQCKLALDPYTRLAAARRMLQVRFGEDAPERRSVDQLRGIEGVRVREIYKRLAPFGVE
jgi:CRISPR-associated protein Cas1